MHLMSSHSCARVAAPVVALVAACVLSAFSQLTTPARRETTMAVDFYAVGPDRLPVRDLAAHEVTIRVDGRLRAVKTLRLVPLANALSADPLAAVPAPPPPPFGSNTVEDMGRTFVLVVDDESLRQGRERSLREAVRRFLGSLSRRDRVAVATVPRGGLKSDFTIDHDRIAEIVTRLTGQAPEVETAQEGACRTREVLASVEGLLSSLAGGEGPTSVLLISTAMYGPRRDAPAAGPPGPCELTVRQFQLLGAAASRARAHFYVIQPDEQQALARPILPTFATAGYTGPDNPLEGLEHVAGVTGGRVMTLSTAVGDAALLPIVRESSAYYTATIDATESDFDGLAHGLEVRLARTAVELRARPQLFFPKTSASAITPAARSPQEMIRDPRLFRDLPIRVAGYASAGTAGRVQVLAVVEPIDQAVRLTALAVGVFDEQGRLAGQATATAADLALSPVMTAVEVPAATYRLRAAAVDEAGRTGTADVGIAAELTPAGPLRLSSLVIGVSRGGAFQPRLMFTTEPVALGYVEIYGGTPGASVSAVIELATTLNGRAVATTLLAIEATSEPGRFTATGAIPLAAVPPGDYVVRAVVGVEGQAAGRVVRTLRKK